MSQEEILEKLREGPHRYLGVIKVIPKTAEGFCSGQMVDWNPGVKSLPFVDATGPFCVLLAVSTSDYDEQIIIADKNGNPVPLHPSFFSLASSG